MDSQTHKHTASASFKVMTAFERNRNIWPGFDTVTDWLEGRLAGYFSVSQRRVLKYSLYIVGGRHGLKRLVSFISSKVCAWNKLDMSVNGVGRNVAHRFYQSDTWFQSIVQFHGARLNVMLFIPVRETGSSCVDFQEIHRCLAALFAGHLRQILSRSVSKRRKYRQKYSYNSQ
jgi:hypothetical protein